MSSDVQDDGARFDRQEIIDSLDLIDRASKDDLERNRVMGQNHAAHRAIAISEQAVLSNSSSVEPLLSLLADPQ